MSIFMAQNIGYAEEATWGYGYLYNWYSASDGDFAPDDWRLPTQVDADILVSEVGGVYGGASPLKEVGLEYWDEPNSDATNLLGFSGRGSGVRVEGGAYYDLKRYMYMTCADGGTTSGNTYVLRLGYENDQISVGGSLSKMYGGAIRLVYTGSGDPTSMTDYDGNVYDVVKIGSQYWTVQSWKCTHLNDGTVIPNVTDGAEWDGLTTGALCAYDNDESNV